MYSPPTHKYGRGQILHIHEDIHCTILFWGLKFSGFRCTKTSVNKRLLCNAKGLITHIYSMLHRTRMGGLHLCGCKDSENFWNTQIYLCFFAKLACFERVLQSLYGMHIVSVSVRWRDVRLTCQRHG